MSEKLRHLFGMKQHLFVPEPLVVGPIMKVESKKSTIFSWIPSPMKTGEKSYQMHPSIWLATILQWSFLAAKMKFGLCAWIRKHRSSTRRVTAQNKSMENRRFCIPSIYENWPLNEK